MKIRSYSSFRLNDLPTYSKQKIIKYIPSEIREKIDLGGMKGESMQRKKLYDFEYDLNNFL